MRPTFCRVSLDHTHAIISKTHATYETKVVSLNDGRNKLGIEFQKNYYASLAQTLGQLIYRRH